jgi:hypothetical protein
MLALCRKAAGPMPLLCKIAGDPNTPAEIITSFSTEILNNGPPSRGRTSTTGGPDFVFFLGYTTRATWCLTRRW